MGEEAAREGRDSHRSLMRQTGQGGPSPWQEAGQEAEQEGSCEAVGLQESCLGPRGQPVTVAVQEHQDHSIGPAKALLERDRTSGLRSLGKAPQPFRGYEISTQRL